MRTPTHKQRRAMIHYLRRNGCICDPFITVLPAEQLPAGVTVGHFVDHQRGCPLGAAVKAWNNVGVIPALWSPEPKCHR